MEKLFYKDCNLQSFSAAVTGCAPADGGFEVTLSATAFYPTGGGQACDLGTLDEAAVLDVYERGEEIIHLCSRPLPVGKTVAGQIQWQRRFDLMQQHTGEHIVSGIIHKLYGLQNVGFHVGKEVMEVDFDGVLPQGALEEIQRLANEAVWADHPVRCFVPSPEELPGVSYRTKRALPWPVRIVEIPGVDSCACCGIHTGSTAQVGLIYIFGCVKFHQGVRLEMACGKRALERLHRAYAQNRQVSQTLSAQVLETATAARQMQEQLTAEKYRTAALQKQLFEIRAKQYAGTCPAWIFEEDLEPAQVRQFATLLAENCPVAGVFSGADGSYSLCLAGQPAMVKEMGQRLAQKLGARGGGKPGFYQGSVAAAKAELLAVLSTEK